MTSIAREKESNYLYRLYGDTRASRRGIEELRPGFDASYFCAKLQYPVNVHEKKETYSFLHGLQQLYPRLRLVVRTTTWRFL